MDEWQPEELRKIAASDDLHISPFRDDGSTYGTPTWIWSVVVDGAMYVRAYNGPASSWYQAALKQKSGRLPYRAKYASSPYVAHMIGKRARSATMRIMPRN